LHSHEPFLRVFPGQWGGVGLSAGHQQALDGIESDLEGCEPRLRSMFAIFTRLTRDEGAPRTESLRPEARHVRWAWLNRKVTVTLRTIIIVPLVLGLVAFFVLTAINSSGGHGCRPVAGPHAALTYPALSCQSAQQAGRS
jgi:hypothetical protein